MIGESLYNLTPNIKSLIIIDIWLIAITIIHILSIKIINYIKQE